MTWDVSTHTVRQEERNKYILLPFCSVQPLDGLDNIHSHWGKSSILLRSLTQRTHSEIMLDLAMASRINTWNQLSQSAEVFFTAVVIRFLLNICRVWTYISPFKLPSLVCSVYMRVCMCAYIIAMLSDFTFSFLFFYSHLPQWMQFSKKEWWLCWFFLCVFLFLFSLIFHTEIKLCQILFDPTSQRGAP